MRLLIICIALFLTACATDGSVIVPNVVAPREIMLDCEEYVKPAEGTPAEMLRVILENKKIYALCASQNKAKKDFINRQQK